MTQMFYNVFIFVIRNYKIEIQCKTKNFPFVLLVQQDK